MQRDNANLLYKKVQDKRDEQVNFVYDFELEHTTERTCETCFTLTCQENIELVGPIKIQNDCDSLELICEDSTLGGLQTRFEPWVSADA